MKTRFQHTLSLRATATAAMLATVALAQGNAHAALVEQADLAQLAATAKATGYAAALVSVGTVSLQDIKSGGTAFMRKQMQAKQEALLAELGSDALRGGTWNNGLGQIGVYVTTAGLQKLQASNTASSFSVDSTRGLRQTASDRSGALAAVERALRSSDSVAVEIVYDLPSVSYELDQEGHTVARGGSNFEAEAMAHVAKSFDLHPALSRSNSTNAVRTELLSRNGALTRNLPKDGAIFTTMIVDRAAFYSLREQPGVMVIRPAGFIDSRATIVDPEAIKAAQTQGTAQVEIVLKGSEAFNAAGGNLSKVTWSSQKRTHEEAFASIIASHDGTIIANHGEVGGGFATLTAKALQKLATVGDPRVVAVNLLRGAARPAMNTATTIMNMGGAWNTSGYRGGNQWVAFLDNGIRKGHVMLQNGSGQLRILNEACFGTNGTVSAGQLSGNYVSPCLDANGNPSASGNSPPGMINAGEPREQEWAGEATGSHGTLVASAAIGRWSPQLNQPTNFQGVAPDAYGISVNVFSKVVNSQSTAALPNDIAEGLSYLYSLTTASSTNPATINLSFASPDLYSGNCDGVNSVITGHVQNFLSRGVPVVAATGNNASTTSIAWPACISNVMKVAATYNTTGGYGSLLTNNTNYGNPTNFTGAFFAAPGGSSNYNVWGASAWIVFPSYRGTTSSGDSSIAAAFMSGYFAVVKGVSPTLSLADITAWIVAPNPSGGSVTRNNLGIPTYNFRGPKSPI